MRRQTARDRDEMMDEHLRRMSEPEPYRSLRQQKERIESERQRAAEKAEYDQRAAELRSEIKALGERPCA